MRVGTRHRGAVLSAVGLSVILGALALAPGGTASASRAATAPIPPASASPPAVATVGPAATTPPAARGSVTPSTDIFEGQVVDATWTALLNAKGKPLDVMIALCTKGAVLDTDCPYRLYNKVSDPTGAGTYRFQLPDASDPSIPATTKITCDLTHDCEVRLLVQPLVTVGWDPATAFATIALTYAPTATSCPTGLPKRVEGGGSTAADLAMLSYGARLCLSPTSLDYDWTKLPSPDARDLFLEGNLQWAALGQPVTQADADELAGLGYTVTATTWAQAPVTLTSLQVVSNFRDARTGNRVDKITMSPRLLAKLFTGQSFSWLNIPADAAELAALNPGVTFPGSAYGVMRAEANEETLLFTQWLDARAHTDLVGAGYLTGPTDLMPASLQGAGRSLVLRTGANTVASTVYNGIPGGVIAPAVFGLVDSTVAARYGLPSVAIKQADGSIVDASDTTVLNAVAAADRDAGGHYTLNWATAPSDAYPMANITYLVSPTLAAVDSGVRSDMVAAIDFTLASGQKTTSPGRVLPRGYTPLPTRLTDDLQAMRTAVLADPPPPTTTTEATTTTAPTTTSSSSTTSTTSTTIRRSSGGGGGGSPGGGSGSGGGSGATIPATAPPVISVATTTSPSTTRASIATRSDGAGDQGDASTSTEAQPGDPPPTDGTQAGFVLPGVLLLGGLSLIGGLGVECRDRWARRGTRSAP